MSKLFSIRLSDEAASMLDDVENKSKYIEGLLMGENKVKVPWLNLEARIDELKVLLESRSVEQPKEAHKLENDEFAGASEASGSFACCRNKQARCKHWQYNLDAGEYVNTLTGDRLQPEY